MRNGFLKLANVTPRVYLGDVEANINEIKATFQANMPKWNFDRLNAVERAILIMSFTHKKVEDNTDKRVIIDVAVRLAKKYCDKDDYKFVNAILDNLL